MKDKRPLRDGKISSSMYIAILLCMSKELPVFVSKLKTQWDERVGLISALEESVQQLQRKAKQREEELISERNTALLESK